MLTVALSSLQSVNLEDMLLKLAEHSHIREHSLSFDSFVNTEFVLTCLVKSSKSGAAWTNSLSV